MMTGTPVPTLQTTCHYDSKSLLKLHHLRNTSPLICANPVCAILLSHPLRCDHADSWLGAYGVDADVVASKNTIIMCITMAEIQVGTRPSAPPARV